MSNIISLPILYANIAIKMKSFDVGFCSSNGTTCTFYTWNAAPTSPLTQNMRDVI